ncbi:hypothetical protein QQS21_003563 [Conoideocrella luteorostrata]|uniref:Uncharacterized protein n=1 Tax=Conoideocrella luteorostrata TaxID=1105319 RepID=A0AAJ0CT57_9HYPO|nr:hypothetical protein QQS21_003563 [Conoideocrella luteorostrata]
MANVSQAVFTHTFVELHICFLCGSDISLAAINRHSEGWKAVAQQLKHPAPPRPRVRQPLVQPGFCSHTFEGEEARIVHSACWNVVTRLWGRDTFTVAELDGFLDCARNVAPFLPDIPFKESPDQLDVTIDHRLDSSDLEYRPSCTTLDSDVQYWEEIQGGLKDERLTSPSLVGISSYDLPSRLEGFIAHALRNGPEVRKSPDASTRFWAEVISMLANSPAAQFAKDEPDRPSRIAQAIRNLRLGGIDRFPHTTNFDVVRANALTILVTLIPIPVEDVEAAEAKDGKRAKLERPRRVYFEQMKSDVPFRLNFYTIRRQSTVESIKDRTVRLGMKYLRFIEFDETQAAPTDLVPTIGCLSAVRLIRDSIGVIAVHARDGPNWVGIWQQDYSLQISSDMAIKATAAEWSPGVDKGYLTVTSDVSYKNTSLLGGIWRSLNLRSAQQQRG